MQRLLLILFFTTTSGLAEGPTMDVPMLLKADSLVQDDALNTVTAEGNVEASNGQDVLRADKIVYNKKTTVVTAIGNVLLHYSTGDIVKAEYLEITDDLKDGISKEMYVLTRDNERFSAHLGDKKDKITVMTKASYTPCDRCQYDPAIPPLWQIKANAITRDENTLDIHYEDAWLEFLGAPFFYLPLFSHADPTVERRQGFLPMTPSYDSRYGFMLGLPYYYPISSQEDYTFVPVIAGGGEFLTTEYRRRFSNGGFKLTGGMGYTANRDWKSDDLSKYQKHPYGHLFGTGAFGLNQNWKASFDVARVVEIHKEPVHGLKDINERTYLKRYPFLDPDGKGTQGMLTSTAALEGFYPDDYAVLKGYSFQDLSASANPAHTPTAFPYLYYQHMTKPGKMKEYWTFEMSELFLSRNQRRDTGLVPLPKQNNRVFSALTLNIPYEASDGSLYMLEVSGRGSVYTINNGAGPAAPLKTGNQGQAMPQISVSWRKPYYTTMSFGRVYVEPQVSFVAAPNGINDPRLPNEDSQGFQFDITNLFSPQRFPGVDLFDDGKRVNYGLNFYATNDSYVYARLFIGQSYAFQDTSGFVAGNRRGIYKGPSDYLIKFSITPKEKFTFDGDFMLSRKKMKPKRSNLGATFTQGIVSLRAGYNYTSDDYNAENNSAVRTHQFNSGITFKFDNTELFFSVVYDLGQKPGVLSQKTGIAYVDECFKAGISYERNYFKDATLTPGEAVVIFFTFKHLGTYENTMNNEVTTSRNLHPQP